ncbi:TetR/AcrR family transcriptional regulator [Sinorhizobium meliloti]|uniref:TetR/AcrR family transcriptional regulator n=1 Tax=Rhizobium meliloti TaxID=382 RepID=UPI000FDAEF32|nr:TetR/AcrR family transcriptional regulator [Sinorhizobium meliloti]MDW9377936.1 TetR family transcriptional regulator [Sinorhizobium meliloti]MDW9495827.1 TetR family transcriptional regulator [Sinorhizobium meliloti]MDW9564858.1 TetR family transcriptional regulator [Sinorhizobium meliloti]MDW9652319.1 TetR family transcriptional regulator [Sinorhizobium meliloti]MDW9862727.1 TetR family transcriptional regulator [Sinorhizobium meliloti]
MAGVNLVKSKTRRETLLKSAAEVFFEQGYAATSIDAIIERVGGSKRNIYNEFGNKEGLFAAIVDQSANQLMSALEVEQIDGRDLERTLTVFGKQLMNLYKSPSLIGLYRIAISEAHRFPGLVRIFHEQGPGRATSRLAEVLEAARERGEIRSVDCLQVSRHFVGMIRDNLLQAMVGTHSEPANGSVVSAVDIVLNGIRAR